MPDTQGSSKMHLLQKTYFVAKNKEYLAALKIKKAQSTHLHITYLFQKLKGEHCSPASQSSVHGHWKFSFSPLSLQSLDLLSEIEKSPEKAIFASFSRAKKEAYMKAIITCLPLVWLSAIGSCEVGTDSDCLFQPFWILVYTHFLLLKDQIAHSSQNLKKKSWFYLFAS